MCSARRVRYGEREGRAITVKYLVRFFALSENARYESSAKRDGRTARDERDEFFVSGGVPKTSKGAKLLPFDATPMCFFVAVSIRE